MDKKKIKKADLKNLIVKVIGKKGASASGKVTGGEAKRKEINNNERSEK